MNQGTSAALSVLRKAIRNELDGKTMYEQAAQRTQDELGKDMFRSFVAEEEQHIHILQAQYGEVDKSGKWLDVESARKQPREPSLVLFPQEQSEIKEMVPEGTSDLEALELARDFEKQAVRLYETAAKDADDPTARAFYEELAKWEGTHYEILDNSYDYLTNKGVWYFQEEEMPFYIG
jgi:rubrerythrin